MYTCLHCLVRKWCWKKKRTFFWVLIYITGFLCDFFFLLLKTSCSVEAILGLLKNEGHDVICSDDAGRFVCNYVYYHSLRFAEQKGHKSLFVHVPLFSKIDEEKQMQFTYALLEAVSSSSSNLWSHFSFCSIWN